METRKPDLPRAVNLKLAMLGSLLLALAALTGVSSEQPRAVDPNLASDKPAEMAISEAAQKRVEKFMNLVLEDPQNEFAFEQVYETYESEKKTWKLLDFFQNAARISRENGNLQLLLGMMYVRFRDYYKATEHFQAALKLVPGSFYGRLMLGRVYLKRAEPEKAREHLAEAVKLASATQERVEALFLVGESYVMDENLDAAKQAWAEAFQTQRYDVPTLQRLARTYRNCGLLDLAEQMLTEVIDLAKTNQRLNCQTLIELAELQESRGNVAAAVERLRQAQKLLLPNSSRRREVEDRIREIYRKGDRLADFFGELEKQVGERPNDANLRKEIARLYMAEGQADKAAEHIEQGLRIDSRDVLLLEKASEANASLDKTDAAAGFLDRLYDITAGAPGYLIDKGEMLWAKDRKEEAVAAWKRVASEGTESLDRYEGVIRVYRKHDLKDEAVESYKKMVTLAETGEGARPGEPKDRMGPEVEDARLSFAEYLLSLDRNEESAEHFAALTKPKDASPTLFLQIADIYSDRDMNEETLRLLEDASARYPDDHRIARRRGAVLERLKKHPEAIKAYFEAYDHAPNWREKETLMEKLISLHLAYGRGEAHQTLADIVLKLHHDLMKNPEDSEPYMGLARVCAVYRPAVEAHQWGTHLGVPGLREATKGMRASDYYTIGQIAAVNNYQQALERDPMRIDAYVGMSRCYMFFDEFERAVLEYKKLAIVNPVGKWKYYFAVGDAFAGQGQMPEARAFWDRVAERAFTDATLYFRLATRYYWAERPEKTVGMLRKAISIYPNDYRYHLVFGNVLADQKRYAEAISEYREALRLSIHTMLLPVRRTMYQAQVNYAHELFRKGDYAKALDVYQEIRKFQDVLNEHLKKTVPEYPDTLVQIRRAEAKVAGKPAGAEAYREIAQKFPEATCWMADHLEMAVDYLASLEAEGRFEPRMAIPGGKSDQKLPGLREAFSVRVQPGVMRVELSPQRTRLVRRFTEIEVDTGTGKQVGETARSGHIRYLGDLALRIADGKLRLSEVESGKMLWEVPGAWNYDCQTNSKAIVGLGGGKLQALGLSDGKPLWDAPGCEEFTVTERYVTLKRVKTWVGTTGGLEEHAHGDTEAIGYIFQVLDAATGAVVFERKSAGSHYWHVPVVAGDLVLLTDAFAYRVHAYNIGSGKLCWVTKFASFFAAPPMLIGGKIFLYMRRPELKTIAQYVLDPVTGDIEHETDLALNSLFSRPIVIGATVFLYDPVKHELVGVDARTGGVTGRRSVLDVLKDGSHRQVITVRGQDNRVFFYTQDGLVVRLDVETQ